MTLFKEQFKEIGKRELLLLLLLVVLIFVVPMLALLMAIVAIIAGLIVFYRRLFALRILGFYVKTADILRDPHKMLYRFEVKNAIARGEKILRRMPDPPSLTYFALGALYKKNEDFEIAINYLSLTLKSEAHEKTILTPSRRLRRFVVELRRIESRPSRNEPILSAIIFLEQMRHNSARLLLEECTAQIEGSGAKMTNAEQGLLRPSISEVLQDVYDREL